MSRSLAWSQLHWPRPLDASNASAATRSWAADPRSPVTVLEARADRDGVRYLFGCTPTARASALRRLRTAIPGIEITKSASRAEVRAVARLVLSTRHRALRTDDLETVVWQLLGAMTAVADDEELVLQLVLGPRRIPLAVPNQSPSSMVMPLWLNAWIGRGKTVDPEKRTALRDKVSEHGFAATVRIGARAASRDRRRTLIEGVYAALRTSEAPGLQARLRRDNPNHLNHAVKPQWRWPLRLNASEALICTAWPLGDGELPGQPPLHPKQVAPTAFAGAADRIVGDALAPGVKGQLGYSVTDATRHLWCLGPVGTGKSTLLLSLITQDLEANRPVVVIEPKDLVADVLERIPESRREEVVLLDCLDEAPVGINPLERHGRAPEVVADGLLATFQALYGDGLGPRSGDILANALAVLAHRDDASLVMLPLLLTNTGFRRSLTQQIRQADPIAAGPFWGWYDGLTDDARAQVIAPLMNKLRPLLRPQLRSVLAQRRPRFNIRQVLTERKVLLVPLQKGVIGPDSAELLGAMVCAELWLALRERAALPQVQRTPVMIYLDEVQDYLRLPTDLADALATSRSLGVAWHLAHQFRSQLSPSMIAAFEANARSKVCFQLNATDARAMAAGQSVLSPEDFSTLPAYQVYASLLRGNTVQPWASARTLPPPPTCSDADEIRALSRTRYGQARDDIAADFAALLDGEHRTDPGARRRRSAP